MSDRSSPQRLDDLFDRLARRAGQLALTGGWLWGMCAAVVVIGVLFWLDLIWELSPATRSGGVWLTPLVFFVAVGLVVLLARRRYRGVSLARRLDEHASTGGQILSGYDLAHDDRPQDAELTRGLASLAVRDAVRLADGVEPSRVVPSRLWAHPLMAGVALLVAIVGVSIAAPELMHTQWLRISDPHGDHPPYTGVTFTVSPAGERVVFGRPIDIYAEVEGPHNAGLELVMQPASGEETQVLPMFLEPGQRWRAALANVTEEYEYFVRSGRARSRRYNLGLVVVPQIESVQIRLTPPSYSRLPVYEGPLPERGLTGLVGSQVEVRVTSNRELAEGEIDLRLDDGDQDLLTLVASPSDPRTVTGQFSLTSNGGIRLRVSDRESYEWSDEVSASITATEDEPPIVRLKSPRKESMATPSVTLPVVVLAEDDYGVSEVTVYRSLNGTRPLPVMTEPIEAPRNVEVSYDLPLYDYGVLPGDEIRLFARVTDNHPVRPQSAESGVAVVHIISEEDFRRAVRQREGVRELVNKYQSVRRRLEKLKEAARDLSEQLAKESQESSPGEDPGAEPRLSEAMQERLDEMRRQLEQEMADIEKTASHRLPYDVDRDLNQNLGELLERLKSQSEKLAQASRGNEGAPKQSDAKQAIDELAEQLAQELGEYDKRVTEPLEHLEQVLPLMQDMMRFVALASRQRSLATRLETYKSEEVVTDPTGRRRMRELEDEQHQLRTALTSLLDGIEDHVAVLPEDESLAELRTTALDFVDAVRTSGAFEAMDEAELGLGAFDGIQGHGSALASADILERFISKCQGMCKKGEGACKMKFQPSLGGCKLGNTMSQLLANMGSGNSRGSGMGMGVGGGLNASPSGQNQMGMYGSLPTYAATSRGRGNGDSRLAGGTGNTGGEQAVRQTRAGVRTPIDASGAAATQAPVEYQRRVGAYMRRLADELDESP